MDDTLKDIKLKFKDVTSVFKDKENTTDIDHSRFTKAVLSEATVSLIQICNDLLQVIESNPSKDLQSGLLDACSKSLAKVVEENIHLHLGKITKDFQTFPAPEQQSNTKETSLQKKMNKHSIVVHNNDNNQFDSVSWADIVNTKISQKLKNVPVSKSVVTRKGEGCIILPDEESKENALKLLQEDFKVTDSSKTKKNVLPKIQIRDIDTNTFTSESKDELVNAIKYKCSTLNTMLNDPKNSFEVLFISEKDKSAIIKVSPCIRNFIMKRRKVYIGMQSHNVYDHFYIQQCYRCQQFGHKAGSKHCKLKDDGTKCLYCSGNHRSKDCLDKDNIGNHKCANCLTSKNADVRHKAHSHNSASKHCPFYKRELQHIKSLTCNNSIEFQ